MAKRVRVVNNIHAFIDDVNRRAASAVMAGANVIGLRAALYAPIDSSTFKSFVDVVPDILTFLVFCGRKL